jgi:hypothetical protein
MRFGSDVEDTLDGGSTANRKSYTEQILQDSEELPKELTLQIALHTNK